jgi:indolepyruvate ferredoxin oxidoreductase alpha subunit
MKRLLSGNEAIALGAWEAGVRYASGYPGTPSTEILESLAHYQGVKAEWASNEKVALDAAVGAAYAGVRALAAMKHVGVNVAADTLFSVGYTGVRGGLVLVSADDPGCWSSQNEQDNRQFARFTRIPCIEPSDSQEAKDFTRAAFEISEQFDTPVMLRSTTRLSHSKTPVEAAPPVARAEAAPPTFAPDASKFLVLPANARRLHPIVEERVRRLAEYGATSPLNRIEWGDRRLGIITSSIAYQYAREIFDGASFLKLGLSYPLPETLIRQFAAQVERLIVCEELDPFFEDQIKAWGIPVSGKEYFPLTGELNLAIVRAGARKLGIKGFTPAGPQPAPAPQVNVPERPPALCPGCPHRSTFYVLRKLKVNVMGDIGCYSIGALAPFHAMDAITCMGGSIGLLQGMKGAGATNKLVAVIGDSTFFHSGMAPLASMIYNRVPGVILILDNDTTGMTGTQGNPGSGDTLQGQGARIDIEAVVRAMGVQDVWSVNAFDEKTVEATIKQALAITDRPAVVIMTGACIFLEDAVRKPAVTVDSETCNGCSLCFRVGCPAILKGVIDARTNKPKAVIDEILCVGCDICLQVCPRNAIVRLASDDNAGEA